jgi:hypothetical protein
VIHWFSIFEYETAFPSTALPLRERPRKYLEALQYFQKYLWEFQREKDRRRGVS